MKVTLTPLDSKDSPMTFDLEEGGSLTLGSVESGAQLSWDLLQGKFLAHFLRQGEKLLIQKEGDSNLLVNEAPVGPNQELQIGQKLTLGSLVCSLGYSLEQEGQKQPDATPQATEQANQDSGKTQATGEDLFGSGSQSQEASLESAFRPSAAKVSLENSRWLFKVLTGPNSGAQMGLEEGKTYTIGSDSSSCDIVLTDLSVSKQHLKLGAFASGEMVIEDLKSRNGVLINGEKIEQKSTQKSSAIITAGATTFMVVDRTSEQKTIVTPSYSVKERIEAEKASDKGADKASKTNESTSSPKVASKVVSKTATAASSKIRMIALGAIGCTALLLGYGVVSLFRAAPVSKEVKVDYSHEITSLLEQYPSFEHTFAPTTGVLTLSGHILNDKDKRQLLSKLSHMTFIRRVDDTNLVVDEQVWLQFNMALEKAFRGVSISATAPGEFVVSGTLDSAPQSESLNRYLQVNFPYSDTLQNHVVVMEQLLTSVNERLQAIAPGELVAELNQGELMLLGTVPSSRLADYRNFVEQIKSTPGIRSVRNLVVEQSNNNEDDSGLLDVTSNYRITGYSKSSETNTSVMVNGRILQRGDQIDGMTVVSIRPRMIVLDREGIRYRINYSQQ